MQYRTKLAESAIVADILAAVATSPSRPRTPMHAACLSLCGCMGRGEHEAAAPKRPLRHYEREELNILYFADPEAEMRRWDGRDDENTD